MKHTQKKLEEQLKYMYGLERFGIKLGLEVMEALLAELGHPHQQFKSVHITGTNGKGSTAAMLESILRTTGLKTALYTSPHLFQFNERIRVNNIPITNTDLGRLIERVKAAADRAHLTPTFFEFTTAVAFTYFAEQKPDIAIIEVGMGGLLDATNVIKPLVSVITNVDLDHIPLIGKNKEEIAINKAGIIKPRVPVVIGESDDALIRYFEKVSREKNTYARLVSREILAESREQNYQAQTFLLIRTKHTPGVCNGLICRLEGKLFTLPLLGRHQITNAATVLLILDELEKQKIIAQTKDILEGLALTDWPGRLQAVSEKPFILVDGAHNPQSLLALHDFLTDAATKPSSYDVLVVGVKNDKDISIVRDTLAPLFSHIITTEGSYEPMPAEQLAAALKVSSPAPSLPAGRQGGERGGGRIEVLPNPQEATQRGLELIGASGSMVITGSLYMIPEALNYLTQKLSARTSKALRATL